jgi:cathepsin X
MFSCYSCWAEAVTGALSDRYIIATQGKLAIQFSPQLLLNFYGEITGGGCDGGDSSKGNEFIHKYGITDDSCQPFLGVNYPHGFEVAGMTAVEKVQAHMCYICGWNGECGFVPRSNYNIYSTDEYGSVKGESQMMAEIYSRGPIACSLNSEPNSFDDYHGGIITCNKTEDVKCKATYTDHVVVIAGWGVDEETGMKYWIGRNSYGTRWGEGAGGGWFRLERGVDALNMESHYCRWAVPAKADVDRALQQYEAAL